MGSPAEKTYIPWPHVEQLREARQVLRDEARAIEALAERLDAGFCAAVEAVQNCAGNCVVTGMGKAGIIGRKIAATLSSTGTPAHFLHPAEAVHGDLGCLGPRDVLLALSNSGETDEVCRLVPIVKRMDVPIIAVTRDAECTLGTHADIVVPLGRLREAGPHGLAPTTSTTVMLALGDALALVVCRLKGFTPRQFAVFHPAGSLGRKLARVSEVMRTAAELRIARDDVTIREAFVTLGKPGRRTGAVMLVDDQGRLSGVFTDSDLARLLERRCETRLDARISEAMTRGPLTIGPDAELREAVAILSERKISELPVVDADGRPIGLIDITDVIGLMPSGDDAETLA